MLAIEGGGDATRNSNSKTRFLSNSFLFLRFIRKKADDGEKSRISKLRWKERRGEGAVRPEKET